MLQDNKEFFTHPDLTFPQNLLVPFYSFQKSVGSIELLEPTLITPLCYSIQSTQTNGYPESFVFFSEKVTCIRYGDHATWANSWDQGNGQRSGAWPRNPWSVVWWSTKDLLQRIWPSRLLLVFWDAGHMHVEIYAKDQDIFVQPLAAHASIEVLVVSAFFAWQSLKMSTFATRTDS